MVLNPHDGRTPWKILRGRVAIVQRLGDEEIDLELLDITSYRSQFKYPHDIKLLPNAGEQWSLDEMADDLNFDKYMEAIRPPTRISSTRR